jgi:hypothetical protein
MLTVQDTKQGADIIIANKVAGRVPLHRADYLYAPNAAPNGDNVPAEVPRSAREFNFVVCFRECTSNDLFPFLRRDLIGNRPIIPQRVNDFVPN